MVDTDIEDIIRRFTEASFQDDQIVRRYKPWSAAGIQID